MERKRIPWAPRHMDVPAANGGGRGAKVTPFDMSRDDRGEGGCLVEDTQCVFEPRERRYMEVRAGDGDRDGLRLRKSESSLLTAALSTQPLLEKTSSLGD
jgi:hypothetical protein